MLEGILVDLVPFSKPFLDNEHRWTNSEVSFWWTAGDRVFRSRAAIEREQVQRAEDAERQGSPSVWFGIVTKSGVPLGSVSLTWTMLHHRLAMLGAAIGEPDYWGAGYGTDALLLIMEYAFDWLDYHKLWLGTMGINVRVLRQMEKVGFREEARRRKHWYADGQWTDDVVFGMLREEWPGRETLVERLGLSARG